MKRPERFEQAVLAHLDAAYNFARWLTQDDSGAEDAVQEACLRAFRFFEGQHGASPKAWFLTIVRNACLDWIKERRNRAHDEEYEDERHHAADPRTESPELALVRASEARWLRACIAALPPDYREVLVLRELEELAYKEIGAIVGIPLGTVMSRLSRARDLLQQRILAARARKTS